MQYNFILDVSFSDTEPEPRTPPAQHDANIKALLSKSPIRDDKKLTLINARPFVEQRLVSNFFLIFLALVSCYYSLVVSKSIFIIV